MPNFFILTGSHIKLLRAMYVGWQDCEFGAPEIDPKRPYGNSGVISDIREILGHEPNECPNCGESLGEDDRDELESLHKETKTALQILLNNADENLIGRYAQATASSPWTKIDD